MIWEIASIEEGERPNDVLLRVNHWHDDHPGKGKPRRPDREPDFVEDHYITGVSTQTRRPLQTPIGQFIGLDGNLIMDWKVDGDGELVRVDPESIADQIQWVERSNEEADNLIIGPVRDRAVQVRQNALSGRDVYPDDRRPRPKQRVATSASVASQRRERIAGYLEGA